MSAQATQARLNGERSHLKFSPQWEGPIEEFATAFAKKNEWKVCPYLDRDDLVQHGRMIFYRMIKLYWPDIRTPGHFFSVFRRSLINKTTNLAKFRTRRRALVETDPEIMGEMIGIEDPGLEDVEVRDLIQAANKDEMLGPIVRQLVLGKLHPRPQRSGGRSNNRRTRDTTNEFLARVAHQDPKTVDMVKAVETWIRQGEVAAQT